MLESFYNSIQIFIFAYPLAMSLVWCISSLIFYFRRENHKNEKNPYENLESQGVSVLIPAHNESLHIEETIKTILESNYPQFEIIIVDDASTDDTHEKILALSKKYPNVRTLHFEQNRGKPTGLNYAALAANYDLLLVIDADVLLDRDSMANMALHFQYGPRVGAVTGNPRVRNRDTLIEKIQVAEYSSIIGLIKRGQRILGKIFTVSGAIVMFRKGAVFDVGLWDIDMITDDINISWKLQKRFYDIRYESLALCWTVVPDNLKQLWRQRLRWSQGGVEVLVKHRDVWKSFKQRRFWPVYIEYFVSTLWSFLFLLFLFISIVCLIYPFFDIQFRWMSGWLGFLITVVCLVQFNLAFWYDMPYEHDMGRYSFYVIWYAIIFWLMTAATACRAVPKVLFAKRKKNYVATWTSPERSK